MAFGQTRLIAHDSWGDAPGYGDYGLWPMLDCKVSIFKERKGGTPWMAASSSLTLPKLKPGAALGDLDSQFGGTDA